MGRPFHGSRAITDNSRTHSWKIQPGAYLPATVGLATHSWHANLSQRKRRASKQQSAAKSLRGHNQFPPWSGKQLQGEAWRWLFAAKPQHQYRLDGVW